MMQPAHYLAEYDLAPPAESITAVPGGAAGRS